MDEKEKMKTLKGLIFYFIQLKDDLNEATEIECRKEICEFCPFSIPNGECGLSSLWHAFSECRGLEK